MHAQPAPHRDNGAWFKAPAVASVLSIIAVSTCVRLLVAAILPAGVDESYTIGIARQLSLSYFDHPPLHIWLVGLWAKLWGSEDLLLLRLPFVALSLVSSWLLFVLTRRLFNEHAGVWAVALFAISPVFGLAHGTLVLPDGPLLAAALGTATVATSIVFGVRPPMLWRWAIAGWLAGLALLSKYHGALLIAGLFLFLASSPRHRHWLGRPGAWLALAIAAAMQLPVIIWNAQNDWVSFGFQAGRGLGTSFQPLGALESLLQQSVYLVPWIAVPLAIVLVRALAGGPRNDQRWFLACLAILPVLIFTALRLFARGLPHWPMPGWVFTLPLLAETLAAAGPRLRRFTRVLAVLTALLIALIVSGLLVQARWAGLEPLVQSVLGGKDPTDGLQSWDPLKAELARRDLPGDDRTFIAAFNWSRAGALDLVFGKTIPVLCICDDARHFAYSKPPADYAGWTGILIDKPESLDDAAIATKFESLGSPEDVGIRRAGRVAVPLHLRIGTGFKP